MQGVEHITYKKIPIAIVFRGNIPVDGVEFFTDDQNAFQVGVHYRKKGVALTPHIHLLKAPLTISTIQEVLFIQSGKILVTLYSEHGDEIEKKTLTTGDSILLMAGGHGVEFLEDTRLFEVKQGPYPGTAYAKLYLKNSLSQS